MLIVKELVDEGLAFLNSISIEELKKLRSEVGLIRTCPMCDVGHLTPIRFAEEFNYNGQKILVEELEGYLCESCGADSILEDQIMRNRIRIAEAKHNWVLL